MPSYRTGRVTSVGVERPGVQFVRVDDEPAYAFTSLIGPVAVGDRVVVNTTAVDLGLGTGGHHVVHWNLERGSWSGDTADGRLMKLRYLSTQVGVTTPGERHPRPADEVPELPDVGGVPVVGCTLHSQLAVVAVAVAETAPDARVAVVITDTAALVASFSHLLAALVDRGVVGKVVTSGQAVGGDVETVSALEGVAEAATDADVVLVGPGPGVAGSGTALGFADVALAGVLDGTVALGGRAAVAVRASSADPRRRHRGLSHHTATVLRLTARPLCVPVADDPDAERVRAAVDDAASWTGHDVVEVDVPDLVVAADRRDLRITSMGRDLSDDPLFWRSAGAAGVWAGSLGLS